MWRLTSSLPNCALHWTSLATRPAMTSSPAVIVIAATANSLSPSVDTRCAGKPSHIASSVMTLGTSIRTGKPCSIGSGSPFIPIASMASRPSRMTAVGVPMVMPSLE